MARAGAEAVSIRLGALLVRPQAQLDGFKSRVLRDVARASEERRWHYEVNWLSVVHDLPTASAPLELLVVGNDVLPSSHGHVIVKGNGDSLATGRFDAFILTASLRSDGVVHVAELRVVDAALRLLELALLVA